MIKWDALNKPKEFRGLGFINTIAMNIALLSRWISRIESEEESPCRRLLRKKNIWVMVALSKVVQKQLTVLARLVEGERLVSLW